MPECPIPSARILLVSQIQGGNCPPCPPVRYAYAFCRLCRRTIVCLAACNVRCQRMRNLYASADFIPAIKRPAFMRRNHSGVHCKRTGGALATNVPSPVAMTSRTMTSRTLTSSLRHADVRRRRKSDAPDRQVSNVACATIARKQNSTTLIVIVRVFHNSHNASVTACLPVPVSAKCATDLNAHSCGIK